MSPNIQNYREYIKVELLRRGVYNVFYADNNKFVGNFLLGPDGYYTFDSNPTGEWSDYILIGIGLRLLDINLQVSKEIQRNINQS